jgi:hypothetical protein
LIESQLVDNIIETEAAKPDVGSSDKDKHLNKFKEEG